MKKVLVFLTVIAFVFASGHVFGAQTFQGNLTGDAATATTNANLTGPITIGRVDIS